MKATKDIYAKLDVSETQKTSEINLELLKVRNELEAAQQRAAENHDQMMQKISEIVKTAIAKDEHERKTIQQELLTAQADLQSEQHERARVIQQLQESQNALSSLQSECESKGQQPTHKGEEQATLQSLTKDPKKPHAAIIRLQEGDQLAQGLQSDKATEMLENELAKLQIRMQNQEIERKYMMQKLEESQSELMKVQQHLAEQDQSADNKTVSPYSSDMLLNSPGRSESSDTNGKSIPPEASAAQPPSRPSLHIPSSIIETDQPAQPQSQSLVYTQSSKGETDESAQRPEETVGIVVPSAAKTSLSPSSEVTKAETVPAEIARIQKVAADDALRTLNVAKDEAARIRWLAKAQAEWIQRQAATDISCTSDPLPRAVQTPPRSVTRSATQEAWFSSHGDTECRSPSWDSLAKVSEVERLRSIVLANAGMDSPPHDPHEQDDAMLSFEEVDSNGDGVLDPYEFSHAMRHPRMKRTSHDRPAAQRASLAAVSQPRSLSSPTKSQRHSLRSLPVSLSPTHSRGEAIHQAGLRRASPQSASSEITYKRHSPPPAQIQAVQEVYSLERQAKSLTEAMMLEATKLLEGNAVAKGDEPQSQAREAVKQQSLGAQGQNVAEASPRTRGYMADNNIRNGRQKVIDDAVAKVVKEAAEMVLYATLETEDGRLVQPRGAASSLADKLNGAGVAGRQHYKHGTRSRQSSRSPVGFQEDRHNIHRSMTSLDRLITTDHQWCQDMNIEAPQGQSGQRRNGWGFLHRGRSAGEQHELPEQRKTKKGKRKSSPQKLRSSRQQWSPEKSTERSSSSASGRTLFSEKSRSQWSKKSLTNKI